MPPAIVEVIAPSRLHFGLLSFGRPGGRQFGGVGAMIDAPGLRLRISSDSTLAVSGALQERSREFLSGLIRRLGLAAPPACRVDVLSAPTDHVGLGTGTQLALSLAAGLIEFLGRPPLSPAELAVLTGRAERSAVGTYGFVRGGLLLEEGKQSGEVISPNVQRVELPTDWRFLLVIPQGQRGLAGEQERSAFRELPPVPEATSRQLYSEATERMLPAARTADFAAFGESLYRYGYQAGMCFAPRQGGPFASPRIAQLVEVLRAGGVRGVGQSSWGPTVFALCESDVAARRLYDQLAAELAESDRLMIARPNNAGATIRRSPNVEA